MQVTLLYFNDCPNWEITSATLESLAQELGFDLCRQLVETPAEAERLRFRGSPTVLVDGRDAFADGDRQYALSCRVYWTEHGLAGAPSERQLREVLGSG